MQATTSSSSKGTRLSVGGSSILVIFVILTLTTFATLSLVFAVSDHNSSIKTREAFGQYYTADGVAEDLLKEIDEILGQSDSSGDYLTQAEFMLQALPWAYVAPSGDGLTVQYAVVVSDVPQLLIEIQVELFISPDPSVAVERRQWRMVTTVRKDEEAALNLWDHDEAPVFADLPPVPVAD